MAIIDETERKPNYYNDIHTFGKFAEQDFIDNFNKKNNQNAKLFDVRTIKVYQHYDIDFIIDKYGNKTLPVLNNVLNNDRFQKIEVKYNSRALDTGYLAYESISHSSLGWGETTKCDLMYMVFCEKNTFNVKKRAWIHMKKWKEYLADRKNIKKINYIVNESIVDLLCNIVDLEKKGVLTYIL